MPISRRAFLFRTTAGAAAVGALAAGQRLLGAATTPVSAATVEGARVGAGTQPRTSVIAPSDPVFVHIRDQATGEIALYVGRREIVRHDPDLVAHLLQAV